MEVKSNTPIPYALPIDKCKWAWQLLLLGCPLQKQIFVNWNLYCSWGLMGPLTLLLISWPFIWISGKSLYFSSLNSEFSLLILWWDSGVLLNLIFVFPSQWFPKFIFKIALKWPLNMRPLFTVYCHRLNLVGKKCISNLYILRR